MKKIIIGLILSLITVTAFSQSSRYCVIDSKYILEKMPEYSDAQKKLDALSETWEKEISDKMQAIDVMYRTYQSERPLMSETNRQKKEDEIIQKEKEVKELQKKYFGYEGELYKQRQTLIKPLQDRLFNAVQQYAQSKNMDMVYDKSGGITIFYADPNLDKSDEILKIINKK